MAGGAARGHVDTTTNIDIALAASCDKACPNLLPSEGHCDRDVCGACTCTETLVSQLTFDASSVASKWSTNGSSLSLNGNGYLGLDYCVSGDTLKLHQSFGDVTYVLARAGCRGTAIACRDRDAATCSKGSGCGAGHCAGSCADFKTEPECSAHPTSCIWFSSCGDFAGGLMCGNSIDAAGCQTRPSCHWATDGCDGIAKACAALDLASCSAQPGCSFAPL
jgi:hypothetical protein